MTQTELVAKADKRSVGLDLVRAAAILLVVIRHMQLGAGGGENIILRAIEKMFDCLDTIGWIGVDLFFVLSGFLVSGLLFQELRRTGRIAYGRFLIRRGFKIYPSFWLFLIAAHLFGPLEGRSPTPMSYVHEVFFLQNYLDGVSVHTWSLAVEEHFYLLLCLLLFLCCCSHSSRAPRLLAWCSLLICLSVLGARCYCFFVLGADWGTLNFRTHYRIDGLFWGVILSYLYHYGAWTQGLRRYRPLLLLVGLILWSPSYLYHDSVNVTVGPTLFSWGSMCFTLYGATSRLWKNRAWAPLAAVGIHSYTIYLWHPLYQQAVGRWFFSHIQESHLALVLSISSVCLIGILLSKLVEQPFLKLRDRLFPSSFREGLLRIRDQRGSFGE